MGRLREAAMTGNYPGSPGWKEPGTSREAAARAAPSAAETRTKVLDAIRANPRTADEVAAALGLSVLTVRPRVSELRADNKIEPSGERRRNASGANAAVWKERRTDEDDGRDCGQAGRA